jgi:hypothetical protein
VILKFEPSFTIRVNYNGEIESICSVLRELFPDVKWRFGCSAQLEKNYIHVTKNEFFAAARVGEPKGHMYDALCIQWRKSRFSLHNYSRHKKLGNE